jgi:hypothetical protein
MSPARQVLATFGVCVLLPCALLLGLWWASRWPVPESYSESVGEESDTLFATLSQPNNRKPWRPDRPFGKE